MEEKRANKSLTKARGYRTTEGTEFAKMEKQKKECILARTKGEG
jgi:hypothetical protein